MRHGDPLLVVAAETPRRQALGFPPFGGLAELRARAEAVAAACAAVAEAGPGGRPSSGPVADGRPSGAGAGAVARPSSATRSRRRASTPPAPRDACASTSTPAGSDVRLPLRAAVATG